MLRATRGVLVDPKGMTELGGWAVVWGLEAFRREWPARHARVIARPIPGEDMRAWLDGVCEWIFHHGSVMLGLDELANVVTASRPLRWVDTCLQWGRQKGITVVACVQRPKRIPLALMSEADTVVVFELHHPADRETIEELTGHPYVTPRRDHGFWLWDGLTNPIECAPLDIGAG